MGCGFDSGTAILFLPIHQAKNTDNVHASLTCGSDGVDGGAARGAYVIDNDHTRAGLAKAFDAASRAMGFFRLAYEEAMHKWRGWLVRVLPGAGRGDVRDQGVCAHGESADGGRMQIVFANQVVEQQPSQASAIGVQRGGAAVDVVVAARTGGEHKVSQAEGVLRDQVEKGVPMVRHGCKQIVAIPLPEPQRAGIGVGVSCARKDSPVTGASLLPHSTQAKDGLNGAPGESRIAKS